MPIWRSSVLQTGTPTPAAQGLSAWAFDPAAATASTTLTGGTIYLVKISNPPADTVTKVYWGVATAGATATAGQNHVGLYSSAGTKLASTGVDSDAGAGTGLKTTTITGQLLDPGSYYYVAFVFNASTVPTLVRAFTGNTAAATASAGATASGYRFAVNGTAQTTLPSSLTLSNNSTTNAHAIWAALGT